MGRSQVAQPRQATALRRRIPWNQILFLFPSMPGQTPRYRMRRQRRKILAVFERTSVGAVMAAQLLVRRR